MDVLAVKSSRVRDQVSSEPQLKPETMSSVSLCGISTVQEIEMLEMLIRGEILSCYCNVRVLLKFVLN